MVTSPVGMSDSVPCKKRVGLWRYLIGLGIFGMLAYVVSAPYLTLYQLQKAAQTKNVDALEDLVDFPSVRESVKQSFGAAVRKDMVEERRNQSAARMAMATTLIDHEADAVASPSYIAALIVYQTKRIGKQVRQSVAPTLAPESPSSTESMPTATPDSGQPQMTRGYKGISRFHVHFGDPKDQTDGVTLVLRRQGLFTWKLTAIRLDRETP